MSEQKTSKTVRRGTGKYLRYRTLNRREENRSLRRRRHEKREEKLQRLAARRLKKYRETGQEPPTETGRRLLMRDVRLAKRAI